MAVVSIFCRLREPSSELHIAEHITPDDAKELPALTPTSPKGSGDFPSPALHRLIRPAAANVVAVVFQGDAGETLAAGGRVFAGDAGPT
jgi:hypothetical protein